MQPKRLGIAQLSLFVVSAKAERHSTNVLQFPSIPPTTLTEYHARVGVS